MLQAIVLGFIQGLAEFLPISSSGHLVLGQALMGLKEPEILFDIVLHLGTLVAVVIFLRAEIVSLIREIIRLPRTLSGTAGLADAWKNRPIFRILVMIVIGTIPTGLIGVLFKHWFEALFASTQAVGVALLITGAILFITGKIKSSDRPASEFRVKDALVIGFAQGLAITPGISRSGMTICSGLFMGLERELAAKYSFLLSIPAILGAAVLHLKDIGASAFNLPEMGAGFVAALIFGLLALAVLLKIVRLGKLHYFAYYCWLAGLVTIAAGLAK